jgi:hypothetical protein
MSLENKLVKPEDTLIEQTAGQLAAVFYEAGRNSGLTSKYKTPQAFVRRYLERFVPKAIELLMTMLGNPATPQAQKNAIYDTIMNRTNDPDFNTIGIKEFENPFEFTSDKVVTQPPVIVNTKSVAEILNPKPKHIDDIIGMAMPKAESKKEIN